MLEFCQGTFFLFYWYRQIQYNNKAKWGHCHHQTGCHIEISAHKACLRTQKHHVDVKQKCLTEGIVIYQELLQGHNTKHRYECTTGSSLLDNLDV